MDKQFFNRVVVLDAGLPGQTGRSWSGLRIGFEVEKLGDKTPDTAAIEVFNLNPDSRSFLSEPGTVVRLAAGYTGQGDSPPEVFMGDIRPESIVHAREGTDIVSRFEAADGGVKLQTTRLAASFAGPIGTRDLLREVAAKMGLDYAQLPDALPDQQYMCGYSIFGPVRESLDDIVQSAGARWTVQDGELVVTMDGEATIEVAVLLSPTSGLIGEVERMGTTAVRVTSLLNGRIKPRRRLQVESAGFTGIVRPTTVRHFGDAGWSPDFYTQAECEVVS